MHNPLKIAFVLSNSIYNPEPFRNQPLVAFYLLTILDEHFGSRIQSSLIDLRGISNEHIPFHLPENDVYLHSAATPDFVDLQVVLRNIKELYPLAKNIAGGPHVNLFPNECSKLYDSIVLGEGEESIIQAIEDIFSSSLKLVYRQQGVIDVNKYPISDRSYSPKAAVAVKRTLGGPYTDLLGAEVVFSRGCPFNCHFCANKKLTFGPVRFRSPENITAEIEYLKKEYNVQALAIKDDNSMPLNVRVARPFLEAIGKTGVKWRGQSRANGIHPDMVQLAKDSGCVDLAIGIESVSPKVLQIVNKKINLDSASVYLRQLIKADIGVRLHFVFGFPGEPEDIVQQTLDYIDSIGPSSVLLSLLCPMPGSKFFDNPGSFGIVIDSYNWEDYRSQFGRFDEKEKPLMVYHFKEETPWGKSMSNERILDNYMELQEVLRNRGLNF